MPLPSLLLGDVIQECSKALRRLRAPYAAGAAAAAGAGAGRVDGGERLRGGGRGGEDVIAGGASGGRGGRDAVRGVPPRKLRLECPRADASPVSVSGSQGPAHSTSAGGG